MIEQLENMPEGVIGFKAHATIDARDYEELLIPKTEEAIKKYGKIGFIYVIADDFESFTMKAGYDDLIVGLKHWKDFSRIAVVTDHTMLGGMTKAFGILFPCPVKVFCAVDMEDAVNWVAEK